MNATAAARTLRSDFQLSTRDIRRLLDAARARGEVEVAPGVRLVNPKGSDDFLYSAPAPAPAAAAADGDCGHGFLFDCPVCERAGSVQALF